MYIVGKVLKPQGIRGEIKVEIITSFPEHFTTLKEVFLNKNDQWQTCQIDHVRIKSKFAYIRFRGMQTRDQAEELRNQYLYIPDQELQELAENEYYIHDLIGLEVFDESGLYLGEICDVETYVSHDVYVLKTADGEQHLIPAVRDFIRKIDLKNGKIIIRRIEGLIE